MAHLKTLASELAINLIVSLLVQAALSPPPPLTVSLPLVVIQVTR